MIALDTNILARFYCDDPNDPEAARHRPLALRLFREAEAMFVPVTVILEFEWIMRGFYERSRKDFARILSHLLGLSNVTVEDWEAVNDAAALHLKGLDFADALHWARSRHCQQMISFDDRGYARRIKRLELEPAVWKPRQYLGSL
jgi:predicted nucleic-acid-binding protein